MTSPGDAPPEDGALFAPAGELRYDPDEDKVQCHLCGAWFRTLAPGHLRRHDVTADEYRELAGLRPSHALGVPSLSALRAAQMRELVASDARVREGMRAGMALARSGELQARARDVVAARTLRLEYQQSVAVAGRRIGTARARAFRERRDQAARAFGYAGLEDYLRERYMTQRVRIEDLATELGASVSAVRGDLDRFGIAVHHGARLKQSM